MGLRRPEPRTTGTHFPGLPTRDGVRRPLPGHGTPVTPLNPSHCAPRPRGPGPSSAKWGEDTPSLEKSTRPRKGDARYVASGFCVGKLRAGR